MDKFNAKDKVSASLTSKPKEAEGLSLDGHYTVTCFDKYGSQKWEENIDNLVVNVGLDYALDSGVGAGTQITSWFLGLTDGTPTVAAADTMASHAGWAEVVAYDEAARPASTFGAVSSQSIDNVGNEAVYTMNASSTVGGAFLTSDNTKSGTAGTLFSVGAFTGGDRAVVDDDVLQVSYTLNAADA